MMDRCISSTLQYCVLAAFCPRDRKGAPRIVSQDSCAISQPHSAQGLTRETCQTRRKENGGRKRERGLLTR